MSNAHTVKISLVGPESSGKTTLAGALAEALGCLWVPEHARDHLAATGGAYGPDDLLRIARGQVLAEERALADGPPFLVCDTDLVTIVVWSQEKYGRCDPWIMEQARARVYTHRFLLTPDMPWVPDPLRENPHDRDRLFTVHCRVLEELGLSYTILQGALDVRLQEALRLVRPTSAR